MGQFKAALGAGWSRRRARDWIDGADAIAGGRHAVRWVIACGVVLILGVVLAVAYMVNQHREQALRSTERELANTVLLLERHFDQQISQIRDEERDFIAQLRASGVTTAVDFVREMSTPQAHALLEDRVDTDSVVASMCVYDADGNLINTSKPGTMKPYSIAERHYFKTLKTSPTVPFVIELVRDHLRDGWIIVLARRVEGPNGAFLGVISKGILPSTLERFFGSVTLGATSSISMFMRDGILLARYPRVGNQIGTNLKTLRGARKLGLLELANLYGSGTDRVLSPIDGQLRIASVRALNDYPIVVSASTTVDEALAGWREQTRFQVISAALTALIIAAMLYLVVRLITRQHKAARHRLAQEKSRLDTAINNMAQGLLMFDAEGQLIVCNQRYLDMFSLSADVIKPGCTLRELIEHRKERGYFIGDVEAYMTWFDEQLRSGKSSQSTLEPGDGRSIQYIYQPLPDGGWLTTVEDITARRRADERIAHLAHYDPLTDLPNRVLFHERMERELKLLRQSGDSAAVLYIDVDEFKSINDSLGHPIGDELLKTIAHRLRDCVAADGFVARLGGDEFAIVQRGATDRDSIAALVAKVHGTIRKPCDCLGHQITSDASIGVAIAPDHGEDLDQLLKHADLAMYAAKADGRRTWRQFEPAMDARVKTRQQLEQDLRQIISTGDFAAAGFEIHYQPVVCLHDGRVGGCEALLRWNHPQRGPISPAEFIPVAEDTGLVCQLGEWVLSSACREAAQWPSNVQVAVNVSPVQFRSPTLALHVVSALAASGLAASRLELEITEAVLIRDDDTALAMLNQLRALGVRTALDDFGTGYSSLSYLQRFPFDKIKIDRAFVEHVAEPDGSAAIVRAVVNIAAARAMTTTAEGVETEAQRDRLRDLGCTQMQGYLFSAAKPAAAIRALLAEKAAASAAA